MAETLVNQAFHPMATQQNAGLQSEIDSRCPCFAMPASECNCQSQPKSLITQSLVENESWLNICTIFQTEESATYSAYLHSKKPRKPSKKRDKA